MPPKTKRKKTGHNWTQRKKKPASEPSGPPGLPIHSVLPIEVISLIFELLLDKMDGRGGDRSEYLQLVTQELGSNMRQIALATPLIWATIYASFWRHPPLNSILLAFDRAKALPLEMHLEVRGAWNAVETESYGKLKPWLDTFLVAPSPRIKKLEVHAYGTDTLERIKQLLQTLPLPRLEYLEFVDLRQGNHFDDRDIYFPSQAPLLSSLVLDRALLSPQTGPFPNLRSLSINYKFRGESQARWRPNAAYSAVKIESLLGQVPNLEKLHVGSNVDYIEVIYGASNWTEIVTLPHLRSVIMIGIDIIFVHHFFNHVDAPLLESVTITEPLTPQRFKKPENRYDVRSTRSFPSVRSLTLQNWTRHSSNADKEYFLALPDWFPNITTLAFPVTRYQIMEFWTEDRVLLPRLESLRAFRAIGDEDNGKTRDTCWGSLWRPHHELDFEAVAGSVEGFLRGRKEKPGVTSLRSLEVYTKLGMEHPSMSPLAGLVEHVRVVPAVITR